MLGLGNQVVALREEKLVWLTFTVQLETSVFTRATAYMHLELTVKSKNLSKARRPDVNDINMY